jgi:hypothetical protein
MYIDPSGREAEEPSAAEQLEEQGFTLTRPPSTSIWAAFDPFALYYELNGYRRECFNGKWYWKPSDGPSPIDRWAEDQAAIPLNPVPSEAIASAVEGDIGPAVKEIAVHFAVGQVFKYGERLYKKLPDGTLSVVDKAAEVFEEHHLLPKQFRERFEEAGLDIEQYIICLEKGKHRLKPDGLHTKDGGNWNKVWQEFFSGRTTPPNKKDILDQLDTMREQFGLK